jgi:hypothetical protein
MIDRTYGHLARDSEDAIRARARCEGGHERVCERLTAQVGPSWPIGRN